MTRPSLDELGRELRMPTAAGASMVTAFMERNNQSMYDLVWRALELPESGNILEIGCANGAFLRQLVNQHPSLNIYGLDASEPALRMAAEQCATELEKGHLHFLQGYSDRLPFADEMFDRIYSVNHLYFLEHPLHDLKEMFRVLRTDGTLGITIRSRTSMERLPFTRQGFRLYEAEEVAALLISAGFRETEIHEGKEPLKMLDNLETVEMVNYCILGRK